MKKIILKKCRAKCDHFVMKLFITTRKDGRHVKAVPRGSLGNKQGGCERDSGCHSDELEEACWFPSGTGHQTGRQAVEALMKGARCADTLQGDLGI